MTGVQTCALPISVYCNAGICYDLLGDKQKALELYDKGIELNPNEFFILNNRSAIRRVFDDYENGIKDAVRATTANPNFAPAYSNEAVMHYDLNQLDQAEECCLKALSIDPNLSDANFSLSQIYLRQGRYYEGFKQYEFRLNFDTYKQGSGVDWDKKWNGENLDGKTILLIDEQGAGDTILYSRYIPLLVEQGAKIILATTTDVFSLVRPLGV